MNLFKKVIDSVIHPTHARTVLTLLILLAAVPLTVIIAQKQQETRQRASTQERQQCVDQAESTFGDCTKDCARNNDPGTIEESQCLSDCGREKRNTITNICNNIALDPTCSGTPRLVASTPVAGYFTGQPFILQVRDLSAGCEGKTINFFANNSDLHKSCTLKSDGSCEISITVDSASTYSYTAFLNTPDNKSSAPLEVTVTSPPAKCSDTPLTYSLSPNSVSPGGTFTYSIGGLNGCGLSAVNIFKDGSLINLTPYCSGDSTAACVGSLQAITAYQVSPITPLGAGAYKYKVWIDKNKNGNQDAGEVSNEATLTVVAPATDTCPAPTLTEKNTAGAGTSVTLTFPSQIKDATYHYELCRSFDNFGSTNCLGTTGNNTGGDGVDSQNSTAFVDPLFGDPSLSGYKFRVMVKASTSCKAPSAWSSTLALTGGTAGGTGGSGGTVGSLICPFSDGGTCESHSGQAGWQDLGPSSSCGGKDCFKPIPPSKECLETDCGGCAGGATCKQKAGVATKSCECQLPATAAPVPTATITPTPPPGSTQLTLSLTQEGLINTPINPNRTVTVVATNGQTITKSGTVTYGSGGFTGTVNLGVIPTGTYDIEIKMGQFLKGFTRINVLGTAASTQAKLVAGVDDLNNLTPVNYYNGFVSCYGATLVKTNCKDSKSSPSDVDLNGDGNVDGIDLNIFLRYIATVIPAIPTPTPTPTLTPTPTPASL